MSCVASQLRPRRARPPVGPSRRSSRQRQAPGGRPRTSLAAAAGRPLRGLRPELRRPGRCWHQTPGSQPLGGLGNRQRPRRRLVGQTLRPGAGRCRQPADDRHGGQRRLLPGSRAKEVAAVGACWQHPLPIARRRGPPPRYRVCGRLGTWQNPGLRSDRQTAVRNHPRT